MAFPESGKSNRYKRDNMILQKVGPSDINLFSLTNAFSCFPLNGADEYLNQRGYVTNLASSVGLTDNYTPLDAKESTALQNQTLLSSTYPGTWINGEGRPLQPPGMGQL